MFNDGMVEIRNGDCRLMDLADESIQCVVTSPPYWGLRKYAGEQELIWGIKTNPDGTHELCNHEWGERLPQHHPGQVQDNKAVTSLNAEGQTQGAGNFCSLCGAWKGAFGLEPTPELYVQHTIEILREVRRVLRKDGCVFWNIGDSYWGGKGRSAHGDPERHIARLEAGVTLQHPYQETGAPGEIKPGDGKHSSIKPKDLCLIPFRIAIAAQEDGWYVRSVIIWNKPNPMPESVTDRPTESHEYLLMLTRSGNAVYWTHRDGDGTREKPKADYRWVNQLTEEEVAIEPPNWRAKIECLQCETTGKVEVHLGLDVWQEVTCPTCNGKKDILLWKRINLWKGHDYYWDADAVREPHTRDWTDDGGRLFPNSQSKYKDIYDPQSSPDRLPPQMNPAGRNIRSVWTFPTQPYPEAHFAVFPEKLPELCIKAATPKVGCCGECGAPWVRVVDSESIPTRPGYVTKREGMEADIQGVNKKYRLLPQRETLGWQPTCKCSADKVPSLVLDPFMGSGTTLWVAKKLNRKAIGYELSEEYCRLALERNRQSVMDLRT